MSTRRPSHLWAIGIALFVTVLWSSSWVLIRWGLEDEGLPPLVFAALRYGPAFTIETGMTTGFDNRVRAAMLAAQTAIEVLEERHA